MDLALQEGKVWPPAHVTYHHALPTHRLAYARSLSNSTAHLIFTPQNVLEALTGEFTPRNLEEAWAVQREDGSWLLDGLIQIPELKDRLGLKTLPEEDKGRHYTLGGLVMWLAGKLPQSGDVLTCENWQLEVVDLDGKRIDKILATPLPAAEKPGPDAPAESPRFTTPGSVFSR